MLEYDWAEEVGGGGEGQGGPGGGRRGGGAWWIGRRVRWWGGNHNLILTWSKKWQIWILFTIVYTFMVPFFMFWSSFLSAIIFILKTKTVKIETSPF